MRARPDVNCVIHTHPEYAIAFSSLGKELSPMSNDGTMFSAGVPIFSETTDLIIDQAARQGGGEVRSARAAS